MTLRLSFWTGLVPITQTLAIKYDLAHLDLMLMEFGVLQVAQMFPEFKLAWLARTTRNNLPKELDFLHEAQNTEKIRYMLKDLHFLKIPKINYR